MAWLNSFYASLSAVLHVQGSRIESHGKRRGLLNHTLAPWLACLGRLARTVCVAEARY